MKEFHRIELILIIGLASSALWHLTGLTGFYFYGDIIVHGIFFYFIGKLFNTLKGKIAADIGLSICLANLITQHWGNPLSWSWLNYTIIIALIAIGIYKYKIYNAK